jgi:hypothetical protein
MKNYSKILLVISLTGLILSGLAILNINFKAKHITIEQEKINNRAYFEYNVYRHMNKYNKVISIDTVPIDTIYYPFRPY